MRKSKHPESTPPTDAAQTDSGAVAKKKRRPLRTALKVLLWLGSVVLSLAVVALIGFLIWSKQDGSLASLLNYLGGDKAESQFKGIEGSLYRGGRITHLDWSGGGLRVQADNLRADWRLLGLLRKNLVVGDAQADYLRISYTTAPASATVATAPANLKLPLSISIGRIRAQHVEVYSHSADAPEQLQLDAHDLDASYSYQGQQHRANIQNIAIADGVYSGKAQVQARQPLLLDVQAQGELKTVAPGSDGPALRVHAQAWAKGTLDDFEVQLEADTPEQATAPAVAASASASANTATTKTTSTRTGDSAPQKTNANPPMRVKASAQVRPWQPVMIAQLQGELTNVNLASFWPSLPQTRISGEVLPVAAPLGQAVSLAPSYQVRADLRNSLPAPWDQNGLPVDQARGLIIWQGAQLQLQEVILTSGPASVQGDVTWQSDKKHWTVAARFAQLNPALLHSKMAAGSIQGTASVDSGADKTVFNIQAQAQKITDAQLAKLDLRTLDAQGSWQAGTLDIPKLHITTADAQLQGKLSFAQADQSGSANITLQAPGLRGSLEGAIAPKSGNGKLQLAMQNARAASAWLAKWPGLDAPTMTGQAELNGSWQGGWQDPRVDVQLSVPALSLHSNSQNKKTASKKTRAPGMVRDARTPAKTAAAQAAGPIVAAIHKGSEGVEKSLEDNFKDKSSGKTAKPASTPLKAALQDAAESEAGDLHLHQVQARFQGPLRAATFQLGGEFAKNTAQGQIALAGSAQIITTPAFSARVQTSQANLSLRDAQDGGQAGWQLTQSTPIDITWAQGQLLFKAGAVQLNAPKSLRVGAQRNLTLEWDESRITPGNGGVRQAQTAGRVRGIPVQWVEALSGTTLADMGLVGELLFDANWTAQIDAQNLRLNAAITRRSGDLRLLSESLRSDNKRQESASAGIRDAYITLTGNNQNLRLDALWDSANAGSAKASLSSSLARQGDAWVWPTSAPLQGKVQAHMPGLGVWSALAPTGWRVNGSLVADANLSGTRNNPQILGKVQITDLSIRSMLDGVQLNDGQLLARLDGDRMVIERFNIKGTEGDLQGLGEVRWQDGNAFMQVQLKANGLRASNRADRRIKITGQVDARMVDRLLTLKGDIKADQALIILADENKPSLSDDVLIVRKGQTADTVVVPSEVQVAREAAESKAALRQALEPFQQAKKAPLQLQAAVNFDMGPDFHVRGLGLDTRLRGVLAINAESSRTAQGLSTITPRITGTLVSRRGEYRAYGQWLTIEDGTVRFVGPYDNPYLDILAIRPRTEERVGVLITGPAINPSVKLYSESPMSDTEKLSWLILGRESANGGAEGAMLQQAAVALLGGGTTSGGLAQAVGLDEIGYRGSQTNADGTVSDGSVSFGKRLSNRLYITYERSLSGALGTLYVFYDISRRFTLRAQSSEQASALDLIFTRRYDSLLPSKKQAAEPEEAKNKGK